MMYTRKIKELAAWVNRKHGAPPVPTDVHMLRIKAGAGYEQLTVSLLLRDSDRRFVDAGCLVEVSPRPMLGDTSGVRLSVFLTCTFCCELDELSLARIAGFSRIERVARALHARTVDEVFSV